MTEYKNIKFKTNLPYVVRLKYDKPKDGTGQYGDYWIYGVEYEGEEYSFIANLGLHTLLSKHKKGDLVEIMKVEDDDKKSHFELESLSESDIKSTGKTEPNWDRINADKQHAITLAIAMKLAVHSLPVKVKLGDKDYEEIEVRMVKFNAIMKKYLGVTMKEPVKPKFSPLVQAKYDEIDKYLNENKDKMDSDIYNARQEWLKNLKDPTTKFLTESLAKLKEKTEPTGDYESYHESLITACCDTLKTKDRLPVIQTLNILIRKWEIDGKEKLKDCTENECLNLLDEFDKAQVAEQEADLPY